MAASLISAPLAAQTAPEGGHELCRTLVRSLDDGASLGAERCWTIRFVTDGPEVQVTGHQSSVTVDAPPALAALAQLEEQRVETGMFPLILNAEGLIESADKGSAGQTLGEAQAVAKTMIAGIEPDPAAADAMRSFVAQVAEASTQYLGRVPRDLFYPVAHDGPHTIPVALPDGSSGSVTIDQSAITDPASGVLISARRSVTTETGGTTSESVETWVLTPVN